MAVLAPGVLARLPAEPGAPRFLPRFARMCVAAALCAGAAWGAHELVDPDPRSVLALGAAVAGGLLVYLVAAAGLGLDQWHAIRSRAALLLGGRRDGGPPR